MPQRDRQQTVLEVLRNFQGLDPLKELFWSELNYERVNQPLSRRTWTETAAKALAEAYAKGLITRRQASALKARLQTDRTLATGLTDYQTQFKNTLAIGLKVLPINRKILIETKTERTTYGLMTGDSLHLGNMNRHSTPLQDIVTHDGDFSHISGLIVWEPMDVIP